MAIKSFSWLVTFSLAYVYVIIVFLNDDAGLKDLTNYYQDVTSFSNTQRHITSGRSWEYIYQIYIYFMYFVGMPTRNLFGATTAILVCFSISFSVNKALRHDSIGIFSIFALSLLFLPVGEIMQLLRQWLAVSLGLLVGASSSFTGANNKHLWLGIVVVLMTHFAAVFTFLTLTYTQYGRRRPLLLPIAFFVIFLLLTLIPAFLERFSQVKLILISENFTPTHVYLQFTLTCFLLLLLAVIRPQTLNDRRLLFFFGIYAAIILISYLTDQLGKGFILHRMCLGLTSITGLLTMISLLKPFKAIDRIIILLTLIFLRIFIDG